VEYVWTSQGAEPLSLPHGALDYRHYAQTQALPVAKSIADAAGWDISDEFFPGKGRGPGGQPELEFG
jgi:DNA polymerase-2